MTDVRAGADALASALTEEQELLGTLLDLAGREERAIVGGDVAELTELTDRRSICWSCSPRWRRSVRPRSPRSLALPASASMR